MNNKPVFYDLVLIGGGHANIQVIKKFAMRPVEHLRITLISDVLYAPYSGMLPGYLAGFYGFDEVHFDLTQICALAGVRYLHGQVTGMNPERKVIRLRDRSVSYDIACINIGSSPSIPDTISADGLVPMKPISTFLSRWAALNRELEEGSAMPRIAVVGGGAAGIEIALILQEKLRAKYPHGQVQLYQEAATLLPNHPGPLQKLMLRRATQAGLKVHLGERVARYEQHQLISATGCSERFDYVIWATQASAAPWLRTCFATDNYGFMTVRPTLQSLDFDNVFGAGDCIAFPQSLAKAGVFAVREGPTLNENIRRRLLNQPLVPYKPQKHFLTLITAGERKAYASRGIYLGGGKTWWKLKDYIDRKFMATWRDYSKMQVPSKYDFSLPKPPAFEPNTCGGCGSKVALHTLRDVVQQFVSTGGEHIIGPQLDDAVVLKPDPGRHLVESVDIFRGFISDPFLFGRIAVNHALSDVYAMGAKPISAQAIVQVADAPANIVKRELDLLMQGIAVQLAQEGVPLTGGHTTVGTELQAGFAVVGLVQHAIAKSDVQAGDVLILTKPVGTGACLAALMKGALSAHDLTEIQAGMLQSNRIGCELTSIHAMTDVTGFGLAGHLHEMLEGKRLRAVIDLASLPIYAGFAKAVRAGHRGRLSLAMEAGSTCPGLPAIMYDPQTSGGLLVTVKPERGEEIIKLLHERGFHRSAVIGKVEQLESEGPTIKVRSDDLI